MIPTVGAAPSGFLANRGSASRWRAPSNRPGSQPTVMLYGEDALLAKLLGLRDKVFRSVLTTASRRAMRPVVQMARANAPRETGTLARSIGVRVRKYPRKGMILTVVGPRAGFKDEATGRNPVYYAHLLEGGHRIVKRGSLKVRFSRKAGGWIRAKGTGQVLGFVAGTPFMKPALETQQELVLATLRSELGAGVEREAAKGVYKGRDQAGRFVGDAA